MNKLAALISLANDQGVESFDESETACLSSDLINNIHPFVFSYDDGGVIDFEFENDEIPSLPFSICSIELDGDGGIYVPDLGSGEFWILSLVCRENIPGVYDFYVLGSVDGATHDAVIHVCSGALYKHLLSATLRFIKRLRTEEKGLCKNQIRIKRKEGTKKAFTTIKGYIYVNSHRGSVSSLYGDKVEYTHTFEVSGHWRRIEGVGLDRLGERRIDGATWIKPYTKGDLEVKPLIKTRYVR